MKRTIALLLALLLGLGLLAGCGGREGAETTAQGESSTAPAITAMPTTRLVTTPPSETTIAGVAMSRREALALVNRQCGDSYDMAQVDFDDPEYGLQIHSRSNENYKLLCEGPNTDSDGNAFYSVQQFEFVLDDPETGEGHTATSNWFSVNTSTGEITSMFTYDENGELELNPAY